MNKHTATPWQLGGTHRSTHGRVIVSATAPFEIVAEAYNFNKYDRDAEKEENAAFIVRAVNAHEDLIFACERAINALAANGAPNCEAVKECRAALAKAKE